MIEVEGLHKSFNGKEVLRGVNLSIPKGEVTSIMGASGGGKSVLLKHLVGLMRPDRGRVVVDGKDITTLRGAELDRVKRKFSMVFQGGALFDSMTVLENLTFPLKELDKVGAEEAAKRAKKMLEEVSLAEALGKYPDELSGGMKKRVALARALVMNPKYILFDEPTTGLDPIVSKSIHGLMNKCREVMECTDIVVSHDIDEVMGISNRVAMLHEGRIVEYAPPEEFMRSQEPAVRRFLEGREQS